MNNCFACHKPLSEDDNLYHPSCLNSFWGEDPPVLQLDYDISQINELAKENITVIITVKTS